jgi:hypothetical protein
VNLVLLFYLLNNDVLGAIILSCLKRLPEAAYLGVYAIGPFAFLYELTLGVLVLALLIVCGF